MGWTGMYSHKSFQTIFLEEFNSLNVLKHYEHIETPEHGCDQQSTFYAAVRTQDTNIVFALIVLFKRLKDDVLWKVMDETCGPCYYDCPSDILSMLSPLSLFEYSGYAEQWRHNCTVNK